MYASVITRFRPLFLIAAFLLPIGMLAAPGWAQSQAAPAEDEIREMLEERDREIKSILSGNTDYSAQQRDRLKELINGVLDFQAMGQTALGSHWEKLTAEQKDEFVDVFRDVVRAQSMSDLEVYNSKVTIAQIDVQDDSAFVRTMTEYQGSRTPVDYVLKQRDDEWKAEDIIVDEVSTAEGYARSFQSVMRKRGFDALMNALEKKRKEVADEG